MAAGFGKPFRIRISNNKNDFLEIDTSGYLNSLATDLLSELKSVTKKEYYNIIKLWGHGNTGRRNTFAITDMYNAISDPESYINIEDGGKSMSATVTYWVNPDKMGRVKSADKWMERWRDELENKPGLNGAKWQDLPSNEYRAQLMFEEGIIGLPKQSHFRRDPNDPNKPFWTNPNQAIYEPLEDVIQSKNESGSSVMNRISNDVISALKRKGY